MWQIIIKSSHAERYYCKKEKQGAKKVESDNERLAIKSGGKLGEASLF